MNTSVLAVMFGNSSIDTITHDAAALPFGELPTIPPLSPTGILADVSDSDETPPSIIVHGPGADGSPWPHESESPPVLTAATTVSTSTKERTSRGTSCIQHADAALAQLLKDQKVSPHSDSSLATCSHLSVTGSACYYPPFG